MFMKRRMTNMAMGRGKGKGRGAGRRPGKK